MIGKLNDNQIDHVLSGQVIGRIGCHAEGKTYIVPIAYAFADGYIYAHSREGQKIEMLRKNSAVCFQVDAMENMANWRSVVIHGTYEELTTKKQQLDAYQLLKDRLSILTTSEAAKPVDPPPGEKKLRPVFFRISIEEKSGRFEKS